MLNPCYGQAPSITWSRKNRSSSWLAGILGDEVILSSFRCSSGILLRGLTFYPTVGTGFHWRTAVGFSLSPSLCAAELPRCLLCLRHLPGRPTRTCRPHPRSASSFGGWGSRGAGCSSHLGRDQETRTGKSLSNVNTRDCPWVRARIKKRALSILTVSLACFT